MLYIRGTVAERFWPKVQKSDACWEWQASRTHKGYGQFVTRGSRPTKAHRVSYELAYGPIPDGLWVLHRCDNPPCVRPDHLFLGTPSDNMRDCIAKGRRPTKAKQHTCRTPFGWRKDGLPTHCKHGHEFTPENTYHHTRTEGGMRRQCRTCRRARRPQSRAA